MHRPNRTHKRNFQAQWRRSRDITSLHDKQNKELKDFTS